MDSSKTPASSDAQEYWLKAAEPRLSALCRSYDTLSTAELQARRQALAAESAAIRAFLWKFDTSLNELQPISRLPSEVLTSIFAIVERLWPVVCDEQQDTTTSRTTTISELIRLSRPQYKKPAAKKEDVNWLSVTRVCRRWRKDALACSSLWCRMPLSMGTKGIHAFLSRSRNASLTIDHAIGSRIPISNLVKVMQPAHMARTREIRIPATLIKSSNAPLLSMLQNSAPQLEVFSLRGAEPNIHLFMPRRLTSITLPPNLLNSESPRLHTFDVRQVDRWPAYPALFANLRVFSVINGATEPYTFPLLSEMLQVLRSMPLLESLHLDNSMTRQNGSSGDDGLVTLPHLRVLELSGPVAACSVLVHSVRVAAGCKILLTAAGDLTAIHDHAASLIDDLHATGFNVGFAPKALTIVLTDKQLHVAAFREPTQNPSTHHIEPYLSTYRGAPALPPNTAFSFRLDATFEPGPMLSFMANYAPRLLAHALPTHAVTSASVAAHGSDSTDDARPVFEPFWAATLAPCSRLTKLRAAGTGAHVLLRKLAEPLPAGASMLFPALDLLVFDEPYITHTAMFEGLSLYDILLAALQRRAIASVKIPESPELNSADMDVLRALTNLQTYPRMPQWGGIIPGVLPGLPTDELPLNGEVGGAAGDDEMHQAMLGHFGGVAGGALAENFA